MAFRLKCGDSKYVFVVYSECIHHHVVTGNSGVVRLVQGEACVVEAFSWSGVNYIHGHGDPVMTATTFSGHLIYED